MQNNQFERFSEVQNSRFSANFIQEAIVMDNRDPQKMGRLKVWIQGSQSNKNDKTSWITCEYASPFAGRTQGVPNAKTYQEFPKSYGFWAVPPDVGVRVFVFFANGQTERAFWFGSAYDFSMNGMVPGTQTAYLENSEIDSPLPVTEFDRNSQTSSASQPGLNSPLLDGLKTQKLLYDSQRGVPNRSARRQAPSTVYGLTTPRGNHICLDDGWDEDELTSTTWDDDQQGYQNTENGNPINNTKKGSRKDEGIVLKTRSGAQLLISESEGNIFLINRDGTTRIECTPDGHVTVVADKSISLRAKEDLNFIAERDVNIDCGRNFNTFVGSDQKTEIKGSMNLLVDLNSNSTIKGNKSVNVSGDLVLVGESSATVQTGGVLSLTSGSSTNCSSGAAYTVSCDSYSLSTSGTDMSVTSITTFSTAVSSNATMHASDFVLGPLGALMARSSGGGGSLLTHTHPYVDSWLIPEHSLGEGQTTRETSVLEVAPSLLSAPIMFSAPKTMGTMTVNTVPAETLNRESQKDVVDVDGDKLVNTAIQRDVGKTTDRSLSGTGFVMPSGGTVSKYGYWGEVTDNAGTTKQNTGWTINYNGGVNSIYDGVITYLTDDSIGVIHANGYISMYKNIQVDDSMQVRDVVKKNKKVGTSKNQYLFEIRREGSSYNGFVGTLDPGLFYIEDTLSGSQSSGAKLTQGKNTNPYANSTSIPEASGSKKVNYVEYLSIASVFPMSGSVVDPLFRPPLKKPAKKVENIVITKSEEFKTDEIYKWSVKYSDVDLIEDIKNFEGTLSYQRAIGYFRNNKFRVYQDSLGYDTIGYGHLIRSPEKFEDGITEAEADSLLSQDLKTAVNGAKRIAESYRMNIPKAAQTILTEMTFQLGSNGVLEFKNFLKALSENNYSLAADEMIDSKWYEQTPKRAKALADRMRNVQ